VWPRIPQDRLLSCYQGASGTNWKTDHGQADERSYEVKRQILKKWSPGRRVLDFGCFDGGFLQFLGEEWERFGVEPGEKAAAIAASRGVKMIGSTVERVAPEFAGTIDAIVVFDVMEHLVDPVATLSALRLLLSPNGIILIETGDTSSSHWRLIGKDYYYCAIVEHVGFFNRRSVAAAATGAALQLCHFRRFVHDSRILPLRIRMGSITSVAGYYALRVLRALRMSLPPRLNAIAAGGSPAGFDRYDHFLAVLRRESTIKPQPTTDR